MTEQRLLLAIESSCDETAAAIIRQDRTVVSNVVASQDELHLRFGGVVPEIASRAHVGRILPVIDEAVSRAGVQLSDLSAIAVATRPGLVGSLLVGLTSAKTLAAVLDLPLIAVDHIEGHIYACRMAAGCDVFPAVGLVVSGGHTNVYDCRSATDFELIGCTTDDAAGEAFDKSGKLLGLPYPAGPEIDRRARLGQPTIEFAKPDPGELNFSFSGLKTSILYSLQKKIKEDPNFVKDNLNDICASIQHIIVSILLRKIRMAVAQTGLKQVALAGGVSANSGLRQGLQELGKENGWEVFIPRIEYCTDNAAMIGVTAAFKFAEGVFSGQDVAPAARF